MDRRDHDLLVGVIDLDVIASADRDDEPPRPRRWRVVAVATVLALAATGVVGFALFDTPAPAALPPSRATIIYYADGVTELGRLGADTVIPVRSADLPRHVPAAVLAAEDPGFEEHGLLRGPSAIARQYTRLATKSAGSWSPRIVVGAAKLESRYSRQALLDLYLNRVYLGRHAYGIEAGALAYFAKPARDLTVAEAIVLAGLIRSPDRGAYDPTVHPEAAERRWREIRRNLVSPLGVLDAAEAKSLRYPTSVIRYDRTAVRVVRPPSGPTGLVVNQVLSELTRDPAYTHPPFVDLVTGGYRIVSTIEAPRQRALERYAGDTDPAAVMRGQPNTMQAAAVAVQPRTGRVVAYYGGPDVAAGDYAGTYHDTGSGQVVGFGRHVAGSSFGPYDLAAALRAGISVRSTWDTRPKPGSAGNQRPGETPVTDTRTCPRRGDSCPLVDAVTAGLTVPLHALTVKVGPGNVLDMARRAGVRAIWDDMTRVELVVGGLPDVGPEVGLGRYPITVLDHANGMATFAGGGQRAQAHFVVSVSRAGRELYRENPQPADAGLTKAQVDDLTWAMAQQPAGRLPDGRPSAATAGTADISLPGSPGEVSDAWTAGFTPELAVAVWVGNRSAVQPLRDASNAIVTGSTLPAGIYRGFLTEALAGTPKSPFAPPAYGGDARAGTARS